MKLFRKYSLNTRKHGTEKLCVAAPFAERAIYVQQITYSHPVMFSKIIFVKCCKIHSETSAPEFLCNKVEGFSM